MSPEQKPSKPIDIYVRYSALGDRDEDSLRTLEQQEARCRKQLDADGLEAGAVFADKAKSGGKASRPEFDKVLERARSGESGGIIVHDITRWGRYRGMADDIIKLRENGAIFLSCREKLDTDTEMGRFFLTVLSGMAVLEREQIEGRLRVSQKDAVARGVHISPNVPPGYNRNKDKVLVPDPQHKATMAHAFKMAAQGKSRSEIAKYLTERKLPSAGRPIEWAPSRIGRLLANPVYKGEARYGDLTNPNAHEAIIDAVTWARAQREQADPELLISKATDWLLSGFTRCASCRYAMRVMPRRPSTIPVYRCHCTNAEAKCPHPVTISMKALDDYVFQTWAQRIVEKRSNMKDRQAPERDDSDAVADLEAANAAYAELQAAEDELDPLAYAKAETKLIERIKQAEDRIAEAAKPVNPSAAIFKKQTLEIMEELVLEGRNPAAGASPSAIRSWREGMARDIRAVFVRPAETKGRGSKAEDRVKILWAGDELPEMPRRGVTFEPRPYVWDSQPQEATA
jgi:DNA invertase Pin-like site-specific DNA recombinase